MSKFVLLDTRLWVAGADLTGASNKVEISAMVETKETTNYASAGWHERLGGLASSELKAGGFWEANDPSMVDDTAWAGLGSVLPVTVAPSAGAVGDVAYVTQALKSTYKLLGSIGDVAPWEAGLFGSWPTARGLVAHPTGTARTATGVGTAQQLGAVAAGKSMYATLHVLSVAGTSTPTITARVESDDAVGFPSATTRATFTAATAVGGQILRTDGSAITDDWWRVAWTITGTGPSFLFASALAIR
jgi:hypothetical protein